jgi:hypothetical protein
MVVVGQMEADRVEEVLAEADHGDAPPISAKIIVQVEASAFGLARRVLLRFRSIGRVATRAGYRAAARR